ncbi:hypothetical protein Pcinc_029181 [Petrolisthes cinctipes]|uniref:Reelin domain-containing protein n=1 Tax=Petrolisthes cinctipes TaxID=88211 RepID=A0AAE1K7X2_PETCI|nr:hypothetical protein Pcinc_029181 [Petrolisthes cinctipes]
MKWFASVVVLVVSVVAVVVVGHPTGADPRSCNNLQPSGHSGSVDIGEPVLLLVEPGQDNSMEVTIKPQNSGVTYKGFLLRVLMEGSARGEFNPATTAQYKSLCTNETMSAVTHTNSNDKSSVTVKFDVTQPGKFTFEATVVMTSKQHVAGLKNITIAEFPRTPAEPIQITYL